MWAKREELSSLRPAKAAERSKTLTSPPQPLLAPAKFKAGLNFHLVNSFVNRPGYSVSVNISSLVSVIGSLLKKPLDIYVVEHVHYEVETMNMWFDSLYACGGI